MNLASAQMSISVSPASPVVAGVGQSLTINASASGGVAPYSYLWFSGSSNSNPCTGSSSQISNTNTLTVTPEAIGTTSYCLTVSDSASNFTSYPLTITANPRLVLFATANLLNDADSGWNGNWANDNFSRTMRIYQVGADSYIAYLNDSGKSYIIAGTQSPQNGAIEPFNGIAIMTGNQNVTFDATSFSSNGLSNTTDNSSIGSYDMGGNSGENYYFSNGNLNNYFTGISNVNPGANGYVYTYVYTSPLGTQTWIDTSNTLVSPGDIVTNEQIINATYVIQNDSDSGNGPYWALDNYTQHLVVWQVGINQYEATANDVGTSCTFAGANSPATQTDEVANGCATMVGGWNANLTTSVAPVNTLQTNLGTWNFGGTENAIIGGADVDTVPTYASWVEYFFPGTPLTGGGPDSTPLVFSNSGNNWGWTYTYSSPLGKQVWVDSGAVPGYSEGDIHTVKQILNVSQSIVNDPDSGDWATWAYDNFTQNVTVYQITPSLFTAFVTNNGSWFTFAGANSPDYQVIEPANGSGSLVGGYTWVNFTGTLLSSNILPTSGYIGKFDYNETVGEVVNQTYNSMYGFVQGNAQSDWGKYYFSSYTQPYTTWGWTYTYNETSAVKELWFDNDTYNGIGTGDIVTVTRITSPVSNTIATIPSNTPVSFNVAQSNATISVVSSNSVTATVYVSDVTDNSTVSYVSTMPTTSTPYTTFSKVSLLNFSVTSSSATSFNVSVTIGIACGSDAHPYELINGTWTALNIISSTSCSITFNVPADPVIGVFTSTYNPPASNGGSGGSVSSGSGGGTQKPTVSAITDGYQISNLAQLDTFNVTMGGVKINATENFITPTTAGITLNGTSYTLSVGNATLISTNSTAQRYAELLNISYVPLQQTITMELYYQKLASITPAVQSNSTSPVNSTSPSVATISNATAPSTTTIAPVTTVAGAYSALGGVSEGTAILYGSVAVLVVVVAAVAYLSMRARRRARV